MTNSLLIFTWFIWVWNYIVLSCAGLVIRTVSTNCWHYVIRGDWLLFWFTYRNYLPRPIIGFWYHILFSKAKINGNTSPSFIGIVALSPGSSIGIEVFLEPLNKLEVVLVLGPGQFFNLHISLDAHLCEGSLENLQIGNKLIIVFSSPVDLAHSHFPWVDDINDLTIDRARTQLLDFGEIQLNEWKITSSKLLSQSKISVLGTK